MDTLEQPRPPVWEGKPPLGALPAPSAYFLTGEEQLRSSAMANVAGVTVRVTGRVLLPDNKISRIDFTITPSNARTLTSDVRGLPSGWLLDLTMRASAGAPTFGAVWGLLELGVGPSAGFVPTETLRCGFFTTNTPLSMASSLSMLPLDGPGCLRSILGTTPGAGAEISETVPTNARWELLAIRARLDTSATVANRAPDLVFDDGANIYFEAPAQYAVIATSTVFLSGGEGIVGSQANNAFPILWGVPANNRLPAAHRMRTRTNNLQVGDQYSIVCYLVREWMTGE